MNPQQQNSLQVVQTNLINEAKLIEASLPKHMTMEKFVSMANAALLFNPNLLELEPRSLAQAFIRAALDGLAIDNREAAIVPYKGKAQYQVMVDGVLKKIRNAGSVSTIVAKAVFEKDEFEYYFDENGEHIKYKPHLGNERGDLVLAFASAKLVGSDEPIIEVMTLEEIDRVMAASQSSSNASSPWRNWKDRMSVKSVLHRISRRLPNANEVREMLEREIQIDAYKTSVNPNLDGIVQSETHSSVGNIELIGSKEVADLKDLVAKTNSNANEMFAWVSAKTLRQVSCYEDIDKNQYQHLLHAINKKAQKMVAATMPPDQIAAA
ncbi:RecT family recombinase [Thiomicrospira sp.]|uniref:RecT family recombinase n=1 Tax=Thiomicrospira sp. TaxID=935 RepID=UPI002F954914